MNIQCKVSVCPRCEGRRNGFRQFPLVLGLAIAAASATAIPASAFSIGGDNGIGVDISGDGVGVSIGGDSGVNAGVGVGDDGIGVDASIGGDSGVNADVGVGGDSAGVNASIGGSDGVNAGVGVGGDGVGVDVGIGDGGADIDIPDTGGPGLPVPEIGGPGNGTQTPPIGPVPRQFGSGGGCAAGGNTNALNGMPVADRNGFVMGTIHDAWLDTDQRINALRFETFDSSAGRTRCVEMRNISATTGNGRVSVSVGAADVASRMRD